MSAAPEPLSQSVSVGVTGHRVLAELERIAAAVQRVLEAVESVHPGKPLIVFSPLAEGADRLVAKSVLRRPGARLIVPLPLPLEDYATDFGTRESRLEFENLLAQADQVIQMPAATNRAEAYKLASEYVVDHADVMIALWDGLPGQGLAGTEYVVGQARRLKKPVAWVHVGNRRPGTLEPVSLGESQGTVTFERF